MLVSTAAKNIETAMSALGHELPEVKPAQKARAIPEHLGPPAPQRRYCVTRNTRVVEGHPERMKLPPSWLRRNHDLWVFVIRKGDIVWCDPANAMPDGFIKACVETGAYLVPEPC